MSNRLKYLLIRLVQGVFVTILISIATFLILQNSPSYKELTTNEQAVGNSAKENEALAKQHKRFLLESGKNLPAFYFGISSLNDPGHISELIDPDLRKWLDRMVHAGYQGPLLKKYVLALQEYLEVSSIGANREVRLQLRALVKSTEIAAHRVFWSSFSNEPMMMKMTSIIDDVLSKGVSWKRFCPTIHFYAENQYHRWLFGDGKSSHGVLAGDFGRSGISKRRVVDHLASSLPWSLVLSLLSIVIVVIVGTLLGIAMAYSESSFFDRISESVLFTLFTVPSFWMATLLLYYFTNPDYFNWFPPGGVKPIQHYITQPTVFERIVTSGWYLVLPLVCFSYRGFSTISQQMRSSAIEAIRSPYVFAASARGVTPKRILFKHVLKNSVLPLITISAGFLPALFSGSVIIESIFAIPGMGNELYQAILNNDLNMTMAIFLVSGLLGVLGFLLADVLYSYADPRIKLDQS